MSTPITSAHLHVSQVHKVLVNLCSCVLLSLCLPAGPEVFAGEITVFFTGNELGQLKPCGCSGGQLGGFDRRHVPFEDVTPDSRLIIDTGRLVADSGEQNLIKFQTIIQAFSHLGYDVINLTEQDILVARQTGFFEGINELFNCITAYSDDTGLPLKFTKRFSINGRSIDVTVASAESDEQLSAISHLLGRSAENATVNLLITSRFDTYTISAVSETGLVDCLLVGPQGDEPKLLSEPNQYPLVIGQGRLGKYVGKIRILLQDGYLKPRLAFSSITITDDFPREQAMVELYRDYQKLLKDANLLENHPRFVLPGNLKYVGSKSCKLCHDYEYKKWLNSPPVILPGITIAKNRHSNAFDTLVDINSNYDPECVVCHVVGFNYVSGFVTSEKTPQLKDVGCETCHGPGSEHVRSLGAIETAGPKMSCIDCHTPDHSADYAANEKQYNDKQVHWRQPVPRKKVK